MVQKISSIILVIYCCFAHTLTFSQSLSEELLDKFLKQNEKIITIDCSIEQIIYEKGKIEKFSGRYRSNNKGCMRIDYSEPEPQTVISTEKRILWYFPNDSTLYVIGDDILNSEKKILPKLPTSSLRSSFTPHYIGTWPFGFFTLAHHFIFKDVQRKLQLEIAIATNDLRLLRKRVCTDDGVEIMKEMYSDYQNIEGIPFPRRIDVFARTKSGYVRSISYYRNVNINMPLPSNMCIIKVPKKTRILYYGER